MTGFPSAHQFGELAPEMACFSAESPTKLVVKKCSLPKWIVFKRASGILAAVWNKNNQSTYNVPRFCGFAKVWS